MKPEAVGLSASRLARLDEVMKRRYVDSGRLPGVLTMVYRRGKLAHTGMSGHMDLERDKPMREDAIFRIYSMSKPITAVALMMLVEEGLIGLDDDVATHIPSWKNLGVYATGLPSLVASGRAELRDDTGRAADEGRGSGDAYLRPDLRVHEPHQRRSRLPSRAHRRAQRRGRARCDDRAACRRLPLEFSPGTAWNYSVSIDVMGYLVQKLSGMSFGEFLRTRLFEPLGMTDTALLVPAGEDRALRILLHAEGWRRAVKLQDDAGKSTYAAPPTLESGGGGLVSTAHDYMRFCRMMLNGGTLDGVQILSPKTVALFSLNHLPDNQELADMAPPGLFSEAGYSGIGFSIGCGVNINVAKTRLPGTLGEYLLGRRGLDRVLDRPEGRARGGVHDAGHRQRRPADPAPRPAHAGLFGDDRVIRLIRREETMGPRLVEHLLYEPEDSGILWIKFNRPERMNALVGTAEENGTVAKVGEYMRAGDDDPNVRVIVLTGVGRGFCSGANLGVEGDAGYHRRKPARQSGSA